MEPRFHSTTLLHDVVPNKSHGRDYCCVILREDFERLWKEAVAVYRRNRPIICLEDWRESARNVKIGNVGGNSGTQKLINSLVWENGYSQLIDGPTRGDALLDVFLVRPESSLTSSGIVQGVSDHQSVILEVEWKDTCNEPHIERVVPVYNKTDVSGLQTFLRDKFVVWVSNGSSLEEIRNNWTFCTTQNT